MQVNRMFVFSAFEGLENMHSLRLGRSNITNFPDAALLRLSNLIEFEAKHLDRITSIPPKAFRYVSC